VTHQDAARAKARAIAEYHFPRSRTNREALENDLFLALAEFWNAGFAIGLEYERTPDGA
jgi:hypothetical protein